ncbi:hypothetical protein ETB97_002249 [Aspergillus alliaceus]|uniref:Uncharacterized protein n=1 Tax=Petromyces alliaceus TaxID=209559 RepID=A0A8H6E6D9_PETAA|nr:hypothetical protein ETB97_002249 [Aspergillus burnettii]
MAPKDKSKDNSFWYSIKVLQAAAEDTISYSKSFKNYEELQQKNIELENGLKAAYSMIEDHKRQLEEERQKQQILLNEKAYLNDYVEERARGWFEKEKELLTQLEKTKEDAETNLNDKVQDLSTKVRNQAEQLRRVRTELGERETTITGLQGRLTQSQEEVEELKRATRLEDFGPDLIQNIKELEATLHDMVQRYFYKSFPYDTSQCEQITSQEKALLRALLVKVFGSDEQRQVDENIENVVSEVINIVEPLLETGCTGFEDELRHFLQNAADLWGKVQQSSKWVTTVSDVHLSAKAGRSNKGKGTDLPGHPVLVLFPHFITPEESSPLHKGSMLQADSESIKQAPSKWLDVERTMFNDESIVILREVPRYNRSVSRSRRSEKSFTQHLNMRKRPESQTRQSRASRDNSISREC